MKIRTPFFAALLAGTALMHAAEPSITSKSFGKTTNGISVSLYTLKNTNGASATICNYGGIVTSLTMPDRNGKFSDIVLGFNKLSGYDNENYLTHCPYFGALIGRYGNRIAKGKSISPIHINNS